MPLLMLIFAVLSPFVMFEEEIGSTLYLEGFSYMFPVDSEGFG